MNQFQEKMNERIQKYSNKSFINGYIKKEFITEDGDADIFLNIENREDLFDTRTVGEQKDLAYEVYDFIEEKTAILDPNTKIHLHFTGIYLSPREQETVRYILKEHYAIELYKIQRQYLKYRNRMITFALFGVLCLLIFALLSFLTDLKFLPILLGFLMILSFWEVCHCYLSKYSDIKSERIGIAQNLLIEVDFEHKEKDID